MCALYQFLGNPADFKYPDKFVEKIVQWSVIMEVPGLEKNQKEVFKQSCKTLFCLELYPGLVLGKVGL